MYWCREKNTNKMFNRQQPSNKKETTDKGNVGRNEARRILYTAFPTDRGRTVAAVSEVRDECLPLAFVLSRFLSQKELASFHNGAGFLCCDATSSTRPPLSLWLWESSLSWTSCRHKYGTLLCELVEAKNEETRVWGRRRKKRRGSFSQRLSSI